MSQLLIQRDTLVGIADAVRAKTNKGGSIPVTDLASQIMSIEAGGDGDSPLAIEVSTEAEMTALLNTAPVGAIYKYVGETTATYENGMKYELCEE